MKYNARILSLSLLVIVFCTSSPAQLENRPADAWLIRAQALTDELMADAVALDTLDRSLLWGRLGQIWWKNDSTKARAWIQKALDTVESVSDQDKPEARRRKINTDRALLSIIGPLDRKYSDRLTTLLASDSNQTSKDERNGNAEAFANTGLMVVETDPELAAQLGAASLRTGRTNLLAILMQRLRSRESKLADALFNQSLTVARGAYDPQLLSILASVAFPTTLDPYAKVPAPPDELCMALLEVIAAELQRATGSSADTSDACELAQIATPLMGQFDRLLPQGVGVVQSTVSACRRQLNEPSRPQTEDTTREQPLKSVSDLLDAAKEAKSSEVRLRYLARAVQMAAHNKEYERAIVILDGMSAEDREQIGKPWKNWRWEYASGAAYVYFKRQNVSMVNKIVEDTPADIRPLAQIYLANQVVADGDQEFAFKIFDEARQGLAKADLSNAAKAGRYLEIARQYVKIQPTESVNALREAVKSLNRIEPLNGGDASDASRGDARPGLPPIEMPAAFLEIDDLGTRQAVSGIQAPLMRSQLRLGLLIASLERGNELKRTAPVRTASPSRKPNVDH